MTLNVETGVPPSSNTQHQANPSQNGQLNGSRRRFTVGSPNSSNFKPVVNYPPSRPTPQFLPLLSPKPDHTPHPRNFSTEQRAQVRAPSPRAVRRQVSSSPDRGQDRQYGAGASCLGNGRKIYGQQSVGSKYCVPATAGRKNESTPSITLARPSFKNNKSNTSIQSSSLPSTPNHLPRQMGGASRSPSPPYGHDSPRSAASEPLITSPQKTTNRGCIYETGLANIRRRMPYSLGIEKLGNEKPRAERLSEGQEEKLDKDMLDLFEKLKPSEASRRRRVKFLEKLEILLNREWPGHNIRVHAFGSTENHLCMTDSDVDVCITTKWNGLESTCYLADRLAKCGMERVVCVPGAKVPIVKIWDPEYQVACDMNVNNTLALDNTKMIKTYVEIDDRVRPLAMIIKYWTKQRVLNDAAGGGTLSSYTWICMILNFLQTRDPPILPALHQREHQKRPPINGVDISFDDDIESLRGFGEDNKETLGNLLFAFFKKYGHELDYEKKVISVRHGKLLSKEEKGWQYLQNNRLCVEEPFNVSRNLGNTADDSSVRGLHLEFRRAHKILSDGLNLSVCCELYEFPPEEPHISLPIQLPQHRPVTLSRSNSNHKQRAGHPGRGRVNSPWNNGRGGNRKSPNGGAYNNSNSNIPLQPHYLSPELFGYVQSPQDQLLALRAQFQAHARAQVQLAQAHAQMHSQQSQPQASGGSTNGRGSAISAQDLTSINPLSSYAYFTQLWGMNYYYPSAAHLHGDLPTQMSPQVAATGVGESRHGLGRGRQQSGFPNGSRSQSQPPPLSEMYSLQGYGRGGTSAIGVTGSEDEDFADHSSNGNPATPPEEEPDEYVGYYALGGSLQSVPVVDSVDEEEPFMEQKHIVDRQSMSLGGQSSFEDRGGPVIVNGSIQTSSSYSATPYSGLSPPPEIYPYDGSLSSIGPNGSDGTADPPALDTTHTLLFAKRLLEVHTQAAVVRPDVETDFANSSSTDGCGNGPPSVSMSSSSHLSSPNNAQSSLLTSDDELDASLCPRLSPNLRQRAAREQIVWSNARVSPADSIKAKSPSSSQENLVLPPTPVPEAQSPSPALPKKEPASVSPSRSSKHGGNGTRNNPRQNLEQVPPTPAEKSSKNTNGSKNGGTNNGSKSTSGSKLDSKQQPFRQPKKKTRKKAQASKTNDAAPANEADRKGG